MTQLCLRFEGLRAGFCILNTLPWLAKDDVDGKMAITMTDANKEEDNDSDNNDYDDDDSVRKMAMTMTDANKDG